MDHAQPHASSPLDAGVAPVVVNPAQDSSAKGACDIATAGRDRWTRRLSSAGALLFRGFDIGGPDDFNRFVHAFTGGAPRFGYQGGASPRRSVKDGAGLYTSTEYPPHIELSLHNELSYADRQPRLLFFCCLVAPGAGGATTLGDSRRILARLDGEVREAFRTKGVLYRRNLSPDAGSGYSWQDAFETEHPAEAEAACRRIGAAYEWRGDHLRVSQRRPATARHPDTGEEVWFNQADGFHPSALDPDTHAALLAFHGSEDDFRLNVAFGDGTPIGRDMLDDVRAAVAAERVEHHWEAGDVVVLDNLLTAHGRAPFSGKRRIVLAMI